MWLHLCPNLAKLLKGPSKNEDLGLALHGLSTVLQLYVSSILHKGSNLPVIVGGTEYHSCIALVGRKDCKHSDFSGQETNFFPHQS
jgi:hypothetical protein